MTRLFAALLLTGAALYAQTFYATGVSALPQTSPKTQPWFVAAILASSRAELYSFTETDVTVTDTKPIRFQTSVRTGLATPLRSFGRVRLFGIADAGMAAVGQSSGSAFAGGAVILVALGKSKAWHVIGGVRVLKTAVGGTTDVVEIGIGRSITK